MDGLVVRRFEEIAWAEEEAGDDPERLQAAREAGFRRKRLLQGEGDTFMSYVEMGPGLTVDPHSHDSREIIHILAGSLRPVGSDDELTAGDSLVVPEGFSYGFRCGSEGVKFVVIRPSEAGIAYTG